MTVPFPKTDRTFSKNEQFVLSYKSAKSAKRKKYLRKYHT